MANGIDRRYTGIPIIPQVVEEKTSVWDAIVPLAQMAKQERLLNEKKELDWEKIRIEKKSNEDMADYRAGVLSNQRTQESNLQLDRQEKNRISGQNAQSLEDQGELKGKTEFYKTLPPHLRIKAQMNDPRWKELTNTTSGDYKSAVESYDDIRDFVDSAGPLQFSGNLKKLDAAMKHANSLGSTDDPDLKTLKLKLAERYQTVKDMKDEEYKVDSAEIQAAYPEYATQIKAIAESFVPGANLKDMTPEEMLAIRGKGVIPMADLHKFEGRMTQLREYYQRKYRKEHDIGEYEKLIPFSQLTAAQKEQAGDYTKKMAGLRDPSDPHMVPITGGVVGIGKESYGISDEQYDLLEKTMETNEDLWDKWIEEDEYSLADLETDYEAGRRTETDEPTEKEVKEAEQKAQQVSEEREKSKEVEAEPERDVVAATVGKEVVALEEKLESLKTSGFTTLPEYKSIQAQLTKKRRELEKIQEEIELSKLAFTGKSIEELKKERQRQRKPVFARTPGTFAPPK